MVPKQPQKAVVAHIDNQVGPASVVYTDDSRLYDRLAKNGSSISAINGGSSMRTA